MNRISAKREQELRGSGRLNPFSTFAHSRVVKRVRARRLAQVPKPLHAALAVRSGGWCEIAWPGCDIWAVDWSHRIRVGMGGRHGQAKRDNDRLSNALHSCRACHDHAHLHPAQAAAIGVFLHDGSDPTVEPVWYRGRESMLDDCGGVEVLG